MNIGCPYIDVMRPMLVVLSVVAPIALMLHYTGHIDIFVILAVIFGNIALNIWNELLDKETDKYSKPWRPIPSGKVSEQTALLMIAFFSTLTLLTLIKIGGKRAGIGALAFVAGFLYNFIRYQYYGENIFLGLAYGLASYFASYPHGLIFAIGFGLLTIGFNIAVQIQDLDADKRSGQKTLPIAIGVEWSRFIGIIICIISAHVFSDVNSVAKYIFQFVDILVCVSLILNTFGGYKYLVRYASRLGMLYGFILMAIGV